MIQKNNNNNNKLQLQLVFDGQGYKKQWQSQTYSSTLLLSHVNYDQQEKNFIQQYANANQQRRKRCFSLLDYKTIHSRQIENITPSFQVEGQHVCSPCEKTKKTTTNIEFLPKPNATIIHTHKIQNKSHAINCLSLNKIKDRNKPYQLDEQIQKQIYIGSDKSLANNSGNSSNNGNNNKFQQIKSKSKDNNNNNSSSGNDKNLILKKRMLKQPFKPLVIQSSPTLNTISENYIPWLHSRSDKKMQNQQNGSDLLSNKWDSQKYIQNLKEHQSRTRKKFFETNNNNFNVNEQELQLQQEQLYLEYQQKLIQQYNENSDNNANNNNNNNSNNNNNTIKKSKNNKQPKFNLQLENQNQKIQEFIGKEMDNVNSKQNLQKIYTQVAFSNYQKNLNKNQIKMLESQQLNMTNSSLDPWNVNKSYNSIYNEQTILN